MLRFPVPCSFFVLLQSLYFFFLLVLEWHNIDFWFLCLVIDSYFNSLIFIIVFPLQSLPISYFIIHGLRYEIMIAFSFELVLELDYWLRLILWSPDFCLILRAFNSRNVLIWCSSLLVCKFDLPVLVGRSLRFHHFDSFKLSKFLKLLLNL